MSVRSSAFPNWSVSGIRVSEISRSKFLERTMHNTQLRSRPSLLTRHS